MPAAHNRSPFSPCVTPLSMRRCCARSAPAFCCSARWSCCGPPTYGAIGAYQPALLPALATVAQRVQDTPQVVPLEDGVRPAALDELGLAAAIEVLALERGAQADVLIRLDDD